MALLRRQARTSSIESSDAVSSSDEEILPTKKELTLQDDDKAIEFQSVLPEDFEEPGESDNERRSFPRQIHSSASEILDPDKKTTTTSKEKTQKSLFHLCVDVQIRMCSTCSKTFEFS